MIDLPYPHKSLWPNGRAHYMTKAREAKKHKQWAFNATLAAMGPFQALLPERLQWLVTIYPKPKTSRAIDADNAAAAMKYYQDGIAAALGVNDSRFDALRIQFGEKVPNGRVVFTLMEAM